MRLFILNFLLLTGSVSTAQGHPAHHQMILLGNEPIYASHIVFKPPHNYQVILELSFDAETQKTYVQARQDHPKEIFILRLHPVELKDLESQASLSGTISYVDSEGQQQIILETVVIPRDQFKVVYLNEIKTTSNLFFALSSPRPNCRCAKKPVLKCEDGTAYQCICENGERYSKCMA